MLPIFSEVMNIRDACNIWNASDASNSNSNIASSSRDKANAGMPAAHEFVDSRSE
jgi:hypothetical protein